MPDGVKTEGCDVMGALGVVDVQEQSTVGRVFVVVYEVESGSQLME